MDVLLLLVAKPPPEIEPAALTTPEPSDVPSPSDEPVPTVIVGENGLSDDIPVYPGAEVVMSMGEFVHFETGDAVEDVAEFYKTEMDRLDWVTLVENITSDATTIVWEKGSRMATVSLSLMDGKTAIMVMPTTQ